MVAASISLVFCVRLNIFRSKILNLLLSLGVKVFVNLDTPEICINIFRLKTYKIFGLGLHFEPRGLEIPVKRFT